MWGQLEPPGRTRTLLLLAVTSKVPLFTGERD